ncbi:esterase/lipase family protein [Mycobacterium lacus]|nr:alpha/beta fold hydrolase [Mycobacterium lacus]MCV7124668.1 alpha/beta hydrolase [Mycobacterium lacus]ORW03062.1 alpha/beta hydrolase [Mycobacterium lacus]
MALYLTDIPRAVAEYGQLVSVLPLRRALPVGDGHPVLVLPGLLAGDGSTWTLRRLLRRLGYRVHGWRLGLNIGPTAKAVAGMDARLEELHARYNTPVSLIGWSLGGIFARALARRHPSAVRQVITLGSPYRMQDHAQSRAGSHFNLFAPLHAERHSLPLASETEPLLVPATSIYSRYDGMVAWQTCIDTPSERAENIAVLSSHIGYGHHPATVWAIADRLAQPLGTWTPFRPPAVLRPLFPRPDYPPCIAHDRNMCVRQT